jgi:heme-degrading monooxygenase HmoA
MHVQTVTFGLNQISDDEYLEASRAATGTFAALPGLLAKIWLRNADANVYGAVLLWRNRESYQRFADSELFTSIGSDPALKGVASQGFEVIEELTQATQPGFAILGAGRTQVIA